MSVKKLFQPTLSFFFLVFFLLVFSSNVFSYTVIENPIEDKIHSDLRALMKSGGSEEVDVLVLVRSENALSSVEKDLASKGASVKGVFRIGRVIYMKTPVGKIKSISLNNNVESVWPNEVNYMMLNESIPQINASAMWNLGYAGNGVKIAFIDTGIDSSHPDFAGRIIAQNDFVPVEGDGDNDTIAQDTHGHGTHVAGIAAGAGIYYRGVAPEASLMVVRVFNNQSKPEAEDVAIIQAINWAVDPDENPATNDGAEVISMSLGKIGNTDGPLNWAVKDAIARGVVVVIASGNEGYGVSHVPANVKEAITVGAVDKNNSWADFSSGYDYGDYVKPDLVAPGVDIVSARAAGTDLGNDRNESYGNNYTKASGTSMSTPHVAGAVALILQAKPELTPEQVKYVLESTATPGGDLGKDTFFGAGILNLEKITPQNIDDLIRFNINHPSYVFDGNSVFIELNSTISLSSVSALITKPNQATNNLVFQKISDNYWTVNYTDTSQLGLYNYTINPKDRNNTIYELMGGFRVYHEDKQNARISTVVVPPVINYNQSIPVEIKFENSGNTSLNVSYYLYLRGSESKLIFNQDYGPYLSNSYSNTTTNITLSEVFLPEDYSLEVLAFYEGDSDSKKAFFSIYDGVAPLIQSVKFTNETIRNGVITTEIDAEDLSNTEGTMFVTKPSGSQEQTPLRFLANYNKVSWLTGTFFNTTEAGDYSFYYNICDNGELCTTSQTYSFKVNECVLENILVIEEHTSENQSGNYFNALAGDYCVASWQVDRSSVPPVEYASSFDGVVWLGGSTWFSNDENVSSFIKTFLQGTKRLIIEDPNLALVQGKYFLEDVTHSTPDHALYDQYRYEQLDISLIKTTNHPIFNNLPNNLFYNNSFSSRAVSVKPVEGGVVLANWSFNGSITPAIIASTTGEEKLIYLPFVSTALQNNQPTLIRNMVEWLLTEEENPDLTVKNPGIPYLIEGTNTITVEVENLGTLGATNAEASIFIDGVEQGTQYVDLSAGEAKQLNFTVTLSPGEKTISFKTNNDLSIKEKNYLNNKLGVGVTVATQQADLLLQEVSFESLDSFPKITAVVKNIGGTQANNVGIELYLDGQLHSTKEFDLNYGEALNVSFDNIDEKGVFNASIAVNPAHSVSESNYSNNNFSSRLYLCDKSSVLIVDDNDADAQSTLNPSSASVFQQILNEDSYCTLVWNEAEQGIPDVSVLNEYDVTIWSTGNYWGGVINESEVEVISQYNRPMLFEGADIAFDHNNDTLMTTRLHSILDKDLFINTTTQIQVNPQGYPIFGNLTDFTINHTLAPYPDSVITQDGVRMGSWTDAQDAMVAYNNSDERMLYYAFPLQAIIDENIKQKIVLDSLAWLTSGLNTTRKMPPKFTTSAPTSANVGEEYYYDANATDANGDLLSFGLLESPQGMEIDEASGVITWTPATNDLGTHDIIAYVSDGFYNTTHPFELIVSKECGLLDASNTLTTNISTTHTCFQVVAHNVVLDCRGFTVQGDNDAGDYGLVLGGFDNFTMQNCVFSGFQTPVLVNGSANNANFSYNVFMNSTNSTAVANASANSKIVFFVSAAVSNFTIFSNTFKDFFADTGGIVEYPALNGSNGGNIAAINFSSRVENLLLSNNFFNNLRGGDGGNGGNENNVDCGDANPGGVGGAGGKVYVVFINNFTSANFSYNNFTQVTSGNGGTGGNGGSVNGNCGWAYGNAGHGGFGGAGGDIYGVLLNNFSSLNFSHNNLSQLMSGIGGFGGIGGTSLNVMVGVSGAGGSGGKGGSIFGISLIQSKTVFFDENSVSFLNAGKGGNGQEGSIGDAGGKGGDGGSGGKIEVLLLNNISRSSFDFTSVQNISGGKGGNGERGGEGWTGGMGGTGGSGGNISIVSLYDSSIEFTNDLINVFNASTGNGGNGGEGRWGFEAQNAGGDGGNSGVGKLIYLEKSTANASNYINLNLAAGKGGLGGAGRPSGKPGSSFSSYSFFIIQNSLATVFNSTYSLENVSIADASSLIDFNYLDVLVTDENNVPLANAVVNVSDVNNTLAASVLTHANGSTPRLAVKHFYVDTTGVLNFTPHTLAVKKQGYALNSSSIDLSESLNLTRVLYTNNTPPNITTTPLTDASVGELYYYHVNASDEDGQELSYSLAVAPDGMSIDPVSGLVSWLPTRTGEFNVGITVTDGVANVSQDYALVVSGDWFDLSFTARMRFDVENKNLERNLSTKYTFCKNIDTESLVSRGLMQEDCRDLRVVGNGSALNASVNECNTRNTDVCFRLKQEIQPNSQDSYFIYFNNSQAINTTTDFNQIYYFYEDWSNGVNKSKWSHCEGTCNTVPSENKLTLDGSYINGNSSSYNYSYSTWNVSYLLKPGVNNCYLYHGLCAGNGLCDFSKASMATTSYDCGTRSCSGNWSTATAESCTVSDMRIEPNSWNTYSYLINESSTRVSSGSQELTVSNDYKKFIAEFLTFQAGSSPTAYTEIGNITVKEYIYPEPTSSNYSIEHQGNTPPEITTLPQDEANANEVYYYDVNATDADGDELTYTLLESPQEMQINTVTGVITWTPTQNDVGLHNVSVYASDGLANDTQAFVLNVSLNEVAPFVSFISPTPEDGTVTNDSQIWFFVNVSWSGSASNCTLTVNSTNYSMTKVPNATQTGGYCYYNNTNISSYGNYSYFASVNSQTGIYSTKTPQRSVYAELCKSLKEDYTMVGNASKRGATCFQLNKTGITLDCNGNWIVGSDAGGTRGVRVASLNNISVRNCFIKDFTRGIEFFKINNGSIANNTVLSNADGVFVSQSTGVTASDNVLKNNDNYGITLIASQASVLRNKALDNAVAGIETDNTNFTTIAFNLVEGNKYEGILIYNRSSFNNVSYNTVNNNTNYGITFSKYASNNYAYGNTVSNHNYLGCSGCFGFRFNSNSTDNQLLNNIVQNNRINYYLDQSNATSTNDTSATPASTHAWLNRTSQLNFIDLTYAGNLLGFLPSGQSVLTLNYSTRVNVTNATSPLASASVTVRDANNSQAANATTEANGLTQFFNLTTFKFTNDVSYNYTPHAFTANKAGYESNTTSAGINSPFTTINIVLRKASAGITNLTFVSPTPADNTVVNDTINWFFVNASFTGESSDACTLAVNNTNYTMTKTLNGDNSGGYCTYNYSSITSYGNYTYFVSLNATDGNSSKTSSRSAYAELCRALTNSYTMVGNASKAVNGAGNMCFSFSRKENLVLNCNGNWIVGNDSTDTYGIKAWTSNNTNVTNCLFKDFYNGIFYQHTNKSSIYNNTLVSDHNGIFTSTSSNLTISGNKAFNNSNYGIVIQLLSNNNNVSYNHVYNNTASVGTGINFDNSRYGLVFNNTVSRNGFQGILLEKNASYANVSYNTIDNNTNYGIWLSSNSSNNTVMFNAISSHSCGGCYGIRLGGGNGVSHKNVLKNNVYSNNFDGYFLDSAQENTGYNEYISGSGNVDVFLNSSSQLTLVDSFFNHAKTTVAVAGSSLTVNYSVRVNVSDSLGTGIASANASARNVNGTNVFNATTDSSGLTSFFAVNSFIKTSAGINNFTPHNFTASANGYTTNSTTQSIVSPYTTVTVTLPGILNNTPPVFNSTPVTTVRATELYYYDANATDADGDDLSYGLMQAPVNMAINTSSGVVWWNTTEQDVGLHNISIQVSDDRDNAFQNFVLNVSENCVWPIDDLKIVKNTTLCAGNYSIKDNGQEGVIIIDGNNISLNCNNAIIFAGGFGGDRTGIYTSDKTGVEIKNCYVSKYSTGVFSRNNSNLSILNGIFEKNNIGTNIENSNGVNIQSAIFVSSNDYSIKILNSKNIVINNSSDYGSENGLYFFNSSSINVSNNKIINNIYKGILLSTGINNLNLLNNLVCLNKEYDIYSFVQYQNAGTNNTCSKTNNWNDNNAYGCTLKCDTNAPNISNVIASPNPVSRNQSITLTAKVTDDISLNASSVFAHVQYPDELDRRVMQLYDDGTHGDVAQNDGIFTIKYAVSDSTPTASYFVDITASDLDNNQAEAENAVVVSVIADGAQLTANSLPTVELLSPVDNEAANSRDISFAFIPTHEKGFNQCSLWVAEAGKWQSKQTNQSEVINASENSINFTLASAENISWNIACTDVLGNIGTAPNNFTLSVVNNSASSQMESENAVIVTVNP